MAASSSSSSTALVPSEDRRPYYIEHHYLDVYYDHLYLVGCTATAAYIITKCGRDEYTAHCIALSSAARNRPLENSKFMPQWKHYTAEIKGYLHACAFDDTLCVIETDCVRILHTLDYQTMVVTHFDYVDACCMNSRYIVIAYNNSDVFVYDYVDRRTVKTVLLGVSIVDIDFFSDVHNSIIITTSDSKTAFYEITEHDICLSKQVVLLDSTDRLLFTHEIHSRVLATCSRYELSIFRGTSDGKTVGRVRSNFTSPIVDVASMTSSRPWLFVYDVEGCVQVLNWNLETLRVLSNHELFRPHNTCRIPIHRISRPYRSMAICSEAPGTLMLLLPSADLCVIKFS